MTYERVIIEKETTPRPLEEKITIYVPAEERAKYVELLQRTWPSINVKDNRKQA